MFLVEVKLYGVETTSSPLSGEVSLSVIGVKSVSLTCAELAGCKVSVKSLLMWLVQRFEHPEKGQQLEQMFVKFVKSM